jgi:hypothetical protein
MATEKNLNSFRNHAGFHEDCTVAIGKRINGSRAWRKGGRQDKDWRFRLGRS